MRARSAVALAVAGALLSMGTVTAAHAGNTTFQIVVDDNTVYVEQTFTVTGSNACATSPYTVTFSYTDLDGHPATATATGTTDSNGAFTQAITVPEDAEPESDTSPNVQAVVNCSTAAPQTGAFKASQQAGTSSNQVTMTIIVASGVLSTNKASGKAGTVVHVSGTNCLGSTVDAFFFKDPNNGYIVDVTLNNQANTFAGDFTIPNDTPGQWYFGAFCSGTDYDDRPFTLLATPGVTPSPSPTPLPTPAVPVVGPVRFTG